MSSPKENLINTLETAFPGIPVRLQGSFLKDEAYPASFFTFFQNESNSLSFYDEEETRIAWYFSLNAYSTSAITANNMIKEAKKALKAEGWIIDGGGYDVLSDELTHIGRGIMIAIVTKEEPEPEPEPDPEPDLEPEPEPEPEPEENTEE